MSAEIAESGKGKLKGQESECPICLDSIKKQIVLPCSHSVCEDCLEGWRSKFDALSGRTCPMCRSKIPPTKIMLSQLKGKENAIKTQEDALSSDEYLIDRPMYEDLPLEVKTSMEGLSRDEKEEMMRDFFRMRLDVLRDQLHQAKQALGNISDEDILALQEDTEYEELPREIGQAAAENDIATVVNWLGPEPISKSRVNAKCMNHFQRTLLHEAEFENNGYLMRLLLQFGADVDPLSASGISPLVQACNYSRCDEAARILLQWGADKQYEANGRSLPQIARMQGRNEALAELLETPLGGRRCEIVGLQNRTDLNGKRGVVGKYNNNNDRYVFKEEYSGEQVRVKPANLKRCDRTPLDCGMKVVFRGVAPNGHSHFIEDNPFFRTQEEKDAFLRDNPNWFNPRSHPDPTEWGVSCPE